MIEIKRQLRAQYRAARCRLTMEFRQEAAHLALQHLIDHPLFQSSDHIACYFAMKEEMNVDVVINAIWQTNKICYLPYLQADNSLGFAQYKSGDNLIKNRYGILEPENQTANLAPQQLDLVIAPLVAFDNKGHRLGAGGGYYDKTFAFKKKTQLRKPVILGFAYSAQQAEALPEEPWDVALDGVVTELGVRVF